MDFETQIRDMIQKEFEKNQKLLLKKVNQKIDNYFNEIETEIKQEEYSNTKKINKNKEKEDKINEKQEKILGKNSLKEIINSLYQQIMDKSDSILGKKREQISNKKMKKENEKKKSQTSFRGLTFFKHKWVVILIHNNNRIYGGRFTDKYIAAKAYDSLVKKYIGFKEGLDKMNFHYSKKSDILPIETLLLIDKEKNNS